jgi:hypothetical protein
MNAVVKALQDAIAALKAQQKAGAIEGGYGYHITTPAEKEASLGMCRATDDAKAMARVQALDPPVNATPPAKTEWVKEKENWFLKKGSFEEQILDGITQKFAGKQNGG